MSRRRALSEQQAIAAEAWFSDYERVGTLQAKANELQVDVETLKDAIRRVRNQDTKPQRRKLSTAEIEELVEFVSRESTQNPEIA